MSRGLTSKDLDHLLACLKGREAINGPRIGDFVIVPWSIQPMRFSHDWGDKIQISKGGSFHLNASGGVSFSGELEPSIDKEYLKQAWGDGAMQAGRFWIWKEGRSGPSRGVDVFVNCRTYYYTGDKP